ncbi:MAG: energy-coupling factor transporter ATPase [Desulfobacteraceae bacterium]|jgi:energy-coupling factor transport system ATP-binding protein
MIKVEHISFTYPGKAKPSLRNIHIEIDRGECVLITGPTGCGKSTLLKCINGIIPHTSEGTMTGDVIVDGVNIKDVPLADLARKVGLVQQNPDDQIFSLVVEDEVGFGPENLCLPADEIEQRIALALKQVAMAEYRKKSVHALSGGQKQRVAIASMLAMQPAVLLLDEPASQLDPKGAQEVLAVIAKINAETKCTTVLVEHRIHEVAHLVDRIIVMDKGAVVLDADKNDVFKNHIDLFYRLGLRLPETIELFHRLKLGGVPLTTDDALDMLDKRMNSYNGPRTVAPSSGIAKRIKTNEVPAIEIDDVWFAYEDRQNWIVKGVDLKIGRGEMVALLGNNGSGKSTLLLHMCGILKPGKGNVSLFGKNIGRMKPESLVGDVAVVFQDPGLMLFCDTVWKEVCFGPNNLKIGNKEIERRAREALNVMTLEELSPEPPQALSGGQRLRAAVASILSMKPRVLLLDEPTSGQDKRNIISLMEHLKNLSDNNITSVFITHDMETALKFADRIIIMDNGRIIANGEPAALFADLDILNKTSLQTPQTFTLSTKLGLAPSFCVDDLAKTLKAVMAYV